MRPEYPYIKDYLLYRRMFKKSYPGDKSYLNYEDFESACILEEETDAKEWQQHIKRMKSPARYV